MQLVHYCMTDMASMRNILTAWKGFINKEHITHLMALYKLCFLEVDILNGLQCTCLKNKQV